ncbi:MAG: uncharacterized protein PWQ18_33 [Clostridia bacterium]|nr:uncharacterized protein [Clostridia bacterium]
MLLTWLAASLAIALAATLQGITGFGFALIAVPLLMLVFDAHTAVVLNLLISFCTQLALSLRVREGVVRPLLIHLFGGSLIGIPVGLYVFLHFNMQNLKIFISAITIFFALALLKNIRIEKLAGRWVENLVGSLSGFLSTSVGIPGPPVVLFLNHQDLCKENFRATASAYFTFLYSVSLIFLGFSGSVSQSIAAKAFTLLPFAFLGSYLGVYLFPRVSQRHFQYGVPLLVVATGIYSLLTTIF